jgi:serine protease inhibitor
MKTRVTFSIVCLALLAAFASNCSDRSAPPAQATSGPIVTPDPDPDPVRTTAQLTAQESSLLTSCNKFGLNLFREVVAAAPATDNVFISPLSVSYALGLCYDGANGETRDAIGQTLQMAGLSVEEMNKAYHDLTAILVAADPVVDFRVGNSLWSRQGKAIQPGFVDLAKTWFDARVEEIDFQAPWAADTINAWVSRATNDKITKMVEPPISGDIAAMLFNAIYFKASWMFPFDTADTRDGDFFRADGTTVRCRMMFKSQESCQIPGPSYPANPMDTHTDTNITWFADDEVYVLSMPYGKGDYRMSIVIPRPETDSIGNPVYRSIDDIIAGLTYEKWATWLGGDAPYEFNLDLPRFKFGFEASLSGTLKALGMEIAFDAGRADFSNLFVDGVGWIDEVKQKTFIQVDEKGTEAAAVTQAIFADALPPQLECNRPFLIVIHEDVSGAILFVGRIADPIWEE